MSGPNLGAELAPVGTSGSALDFVGRGRCCACFHQGVPVASEQLSLDMKKVAKTMKVVTSALLSSGIALLLAAAALAFQGGLIADSTGGLGWH